MVIMGRDSDAKPYKVGEVIRDGLGVKFDVPERLADMLQGLKFEGKLLDPQSPDFFKILPQVLRGDRLWAVPE